MLARLPSCCLLCRERGGEKFRKRKAMKRNHGKTRQIQKQEEHKKEQKEEENIIKKKVVLERNLCLAELRKETEQCGEINRKIERKGKRKICCFLTFFFLLALF